MFNLTNKDCQIKFWNYTTNTNTFSNFFETKEGIETQFNRWKRKFVKALHASFKKIRITENSKKKKSVIDVFINEKNTILKKKVKEREDLTKIEELDKIIGEECEDREILKLQKVLGSLDMENGFVNNTNKWKQMKKSYPKKTRPIPTGVMNKGGKVITNPKEKKT